MKKLNELTIKEARQGLTEKKFTSEELVGACLEQIERLNPKIEAFITINKDSALKKAREAEKLIAKFGKAAFENKPLLGIPYSVKDVFSTKGVQTTASSNILKGYIPPYESTVTSRVNDAGAILLTKDNHDAFGHGGSTESSDFFTTKNPWDLTKLPGGSSGGTAAAVAANMTIFGIGEDTGGSIRCPASWCGVTGLKPTYSRVSRYGVIAMASSTDCPGPITKNTEDAAIILEIIAGKDQNDAVSSSAKVPNYLAEAEKYSFRGVKIGKSSTYFDKEIDQDVTRVIETALQELEIQGAEIIDIDLISPNYSLAVYTIVQRAEVSSNLARFDGIRFGHTRESFGMEAKKRMMLGAYALSAGYYDEYYSKAQKVRTEVIEDFKKAFKKVDLIVGPTLPSVAKPLGSIDLSPMFGELIDRLQLPASMSGLPTIAIPCGFSEGLPVGMQLIGNMFEEEKVLGAAHAFQRSTNFHEGIYNIKL